MPLVAAAIGDRARAPPIRVLVAVVLSEIDIIVGDGCRGGSGVRRHADVGRDETRPRRGVDRVVMDLVGCPADDLDTDLTWVVQLVAANLDPSADIAVTEDDARA